MFDSSPSSSVSVNPPESEEQSMSDTAAPTIIKKKMKADFRSEFFPFFPKSSDTPPGFTFFLRDLGIPVFCSYCLLWRWIDMEGFYFLPIHFYLNRSTSVVTIQKKISWLSTTQLVGCHIPCRQQLQQSPVWSPTSLA